LLRGGLDFRGDGRALTDVFARARREHPDDDPDLVIANYGYGYRIHGDLQPTRVFGDCHVKRPVELTKR
jgi:hypothetical protein